MAGINMNVHKVHSFQSASTSNTKDNSVSITNILKQGSPKSQNTFSKFYFRDIVN